MIERKLIVTTIDLPYPPRYGHKVDQLNRWKGFAKHGWRLKLICWQSPNDLALPTDADIAALAPVFESIEVLPIKHDLRSLALRLARIPRYPSHVASRIPDASTLVRLRAEAMAFAPAAIVHDGIYGAALGEQLAEACGVPSILRGHNVEHRYFAQQARVAQGIRAKLGPSIARIGLRRWEERVTRNAAWSFQISADDVDYWRHQGFEDLSWAPTVYPDSENGTFISPADRKYDVSYIGNLRLPNNLQGLRWFLCEVMPRLRLLRPGTTLCFAGANPTDEARKMFAAAPDITLVPDAPSADEILSNGRVLVNPIFSGSGVNVKTIEMLRYDAPIVTTTTGAQGFPTSLQGQFVVRNDPLGFAEAIAAALNNLQLPPGRSEARALFGEEGLKAQMASYARAAGI